MTPICGESEPFVNMLTPERIRLKALPATIDRLYHCLLIPLSAYTIVCLYQSGDVQ
ncbi:hypothetical protein ACJUDU_000577 [Vibrio vulnificus]|nr:hypothetical protein [Vibrio vulnificus]HDY7494679.1 hypothetical protein [Vibrio vulnificus]